ncbi:UDP-N-acetylmuramate-L-alanine ligase [Bartonella elizabethae Re6043vi]|uniref:UDP-N-acetylmuramate--L-alanine ligase n=2 Tax=Bartonella elizabethae TaxID=807 RepID=J1A0Y3_BAREL|nr:UDP-N-acetylmuramate--L-alanine ligase [Bartonella elizabethae]EJF84522.1 UDP-N-acetylmuramate-L-alanine ligase [Bartonella elizabethae Re6043vi]EJF95188.1 UDP-N-acetylmuramate-L-alanine ligase [Bartonella elizabethae F9251 = ATCC 49927]VEJ41594.1 UDP-N-acetylmuramate--L-alanine ligase [Bartonella elizabethae]
MKMPLDIGVIHFIGIGGIGMSGIAEVFYNLGYKVQGSDQVESANVERLKRKGINVHIGHCAENLGNAEVVVFSTAVKKTNPEYIAAKERHLPLVRRAEMLAELMRFRRAIAVGGTHGKTTTTSMVAALLDAGRFDPVVINGGIINAYGTNSRTGEGDWMIVEADESDGTFLKLPADIAVVTNIDAEHLDHYGSFDAVRAAFRQFVENVPFYGFAVLCLDHPEVQSLAGRIDDRWVITYGANPQADVRFLNLSMDGQKTYFDVLIRSRKTGRKIELKNLLLPMAGEHNVANATAAIAIAHELGISNELIKKGLAEFGGVKRRFTRTGSWRGIEIFDDYGHHPVEIKAVLRAARESAKGRVIAIAQPHRYSRLHHLFDEFATCFNDADTVLITPVYAAGEEPILGFGSQELVEHIKMAGHRDVRLIHGLEDVVSLVSKFAQPEDYVVFLGAGNITQWACALPHQLSGLGGHDKFSEH